MDDEITYPARRTASTKQGKDGRSADRRRKKNPVSGPRECGVEEWGWQPAELIMSEAWRALGINARRIVDRVLIEHIGQGGMANGELCVAYGDFEQHGASPNHIAAGIAEAEAAGVLVALRRGKHAGRNAPTFYRLTWMGGWNKLREKIPPSNEWKSRTVADVKRAREARKQATARGRQIRRIVKKSLVLCAH
jgi:hypothetical protein